jgi:hypothetical protein
MGTGRTLPERSGGREEENGVRLVPEGESRLLRFPPVSVLSPCPHLPPPREGLDWRLLAAHRDAYRGGEFYLDCLEYGHSLWIRGHAARAVLCLDRAFGAELTGTEPVLAAWPMPYAATAWMLRFVPPGVFIGNPRVHFQHYAGRMNGPRIEQRRWRAWAGWALACAIFPELPGDPLHKIEEPSLETIAAQLTRHGFPGEAAIWRRVLADSGA